MKSKELSLKLRRQGFVYESVSAVLWRMMGGRLDFQDRLRTSFVMHLSRKLDVCSGVVRLTLTETKISE